MFYAFIKKEKKVMYATVRTHPADSITLDVVAVHSIAVQNKGINIQNSAKTKTVDFHSAFLLSAAGLSKQELSSE